MAASIGRIIRWDGAPDFDAACLFRLSGHTDPLTESAGVTNALQFRTDGTVPKGV